MPLKHRGSDCGDKRVSISHSGEVAGAYYLATVPKSSSIKPK